MGELRKLESWEDGRAGKRVERKFLPLTHPSPENMKRHMLQSLSFLASMRRGPHRHSLIFSTPQFFKSSVFSTLYVSQLSNFLNLPILSTLQFAQLSKSLNPLNVSPVTGRFHSSHPAQAGLAILTVSQLSVLTFSNVACSTPISFHAGLTCMCVCVCVRTRVSIGMCS